MANGKHKIKIFNTSYSLLLSLCFCISVPLYPYAFSQTSIMQYTDKNFKISIAKPSGWSERTTEESLKEISNIMKLIQEKPQKNVFTPIFTFTRSKHTIPITANTNVILVSYDFDKFKMNTLDEFVLTNIEQMKLLLNEFTLVEPMKNVVINNEKGKKVVYEATIQTTKSKIISRSILYFFLKQSGNKKLVYLLTATFKKEDFKKDRKSIEQIVKSLKFF